VGAFALFAAGAIMVLLGVLVEARESVAVALVTLGAALMPLAVLLPRLVGALKVSPTGLEAELSALVQSEAEAHGLAPTVVQEALAVVRLDTEGSVREWASELLFRIEERARAEGLTEIPLEDFQQALRDPRIHRFLPSPALDEDTGHELGGIA